MQTVKRKSRPFVVAYLAHLLVPLFFVLDIVLAWRINSNLWWYGFGPTGQVVFVTCSLWLVVGLGLFLLILNLGPSFISRLQRPLVAIYAVVLTLIIVELFFRFVPYEDKQPALWAPGQQAVLQSDPKLMPGVYGASTFTANEIGLRGPPLPTNEPLYRIVTVGGSTTESFYLDDSEEWPHLIMERLNAHQPDIPVWVGNAGQSGRNMVDHLTLMRSLPIFGQVDMLVFLIGINDLQSTLAFEGRPTEDILKQNAARFREQVLRGGGYFRPKLPLYKHLQLYERTRMSSAAALVRFAPSEIIGQLGVGPAAVMNKKRQMRAGAPIVPLPDLQTGLNEYSQRIRSLAHECQVSGNRCLFLSQPSMWRSGLTEVEEKLLWFGWVGREFSPMGYVTASDAAQAMDTYNQALLEVCRQDELECFDLASWVPRDVSAFYDDVHFNEGGAKIVADLITDYLLSTPPFAQDR